VDVAVGDYFKYVISINIPIDCVGVYVEYKTPACYKGYASWEKDTYFPTGISTSIDNSDFSVTGNANTSGQITTINIKFIGKYLPAGTTTVTVKATVTSISTQYNYAFYRRIPTQGDPSIVGGALSGTIISAK